MNARALRSCGTCGRDFEPRIRAGYTQRFCSLKCSAAARPPPRAKVLPLQQRFANLHTKPDGKACWNWQGAIMSTGYGSFMLDGRRRPGRRSQLAHRVAWALHVGPIPPGLCVLHECDNRRCVNPKHLFLGTNTDNVRDMVAKGRHLAGRVAAGVKNRGEQNPNAKLSALAVRDILSGSQPAVETAQAYGVHPATVRALRSGRGWSWFSG